MLINGSPVGFFKSSGGLRQGDPLSPYLFVLGMEAFSILIGKDASKGFLFGFFKSSGGLRQGDPLSPYLFVLGMEAFSILIGKDASKGFLLGYKISNRSGDVVQITHLLFADDSLVFCKASRDHMAYLSWILAWFEAILGLKINLEKAFILLVGDVRNLEVLASELGCCIGTPSLPLTLVSPWVCAAILP